MKWYFGLASLMWTSILHFLKSIRICVSCAVYFFLMHSIVFRIQSQSLELCVNGCKSHCFHLLRIILVRLFSDINLKIFEDFWLLCTKISEFVVIFLEVCTIFFIDFVYIKSSNFRFYFSWNPLGFFSGNFCPHQNLFLFVYWKVLIR